MNLTDFRNMKFHKVLNKEEIPIERIKADAGIYGS